VVVTAHDVIMLALPEHRGGALYRSYTWLALAAARRATAIVADSNATAIDLERYARIPRSKTTVVQLGRDEDLRPAGDTEMIRIRQKYGLPERFLLYLGGFDNRKNLVLLFKALGKIQDDLPLAVAGQPPAPSPPLYPDVAAAAAPLGDRVRWLGRVPEDEKAALYSAATAFVWPSRYEGFGLPPLEAMACGTPVICADASSVPEVTGNAALLVRPDDLESLVSAIDRVLDDAALRDKLREKGLRRAAELTWEKTARETLDVYRRVLDH
jgi:glycosyltransferase involved in cell wall biosynthesis